MKSAEHYLEQAAAALEAARVQTTSPATMEAHTKRAAVLLKLHAAVLEREAADLAPAEPEAPVAVEDTYGRRWTRQSDGTYCNPTTDIKVTHEELSGWAGPLRPVGVANR